MSRNVACRRKFGNLLFLIQFVQMCPNLPKFVNIREFAECSLFVLIYYLAGVGLSQEFKTQANPAADETLSLFAICSA